MSSSDKWKVIEAWDYLKGSQEDFSLQSRIYHSICIATFLVILYNVPFSIAVGLYRMAGLSVVLLVCQAFFYYLSRFRGKLHMSMVIYAIVINVFFAFDFYISSGIQGATLHSFTITYFLIIAIARKKHYWYWTLGNLILVIGLVVYEYVHPEHIHFRYTSRSSQYIDIASTYVVSVILIFACLTYIINNYRLERQISERNELAVKRLSAEKSKLISIISHDFRTPLRNIQGYLSILRRTDLAYTERVHLETELARNTEEAQHLLDNLLIWSKRQLGGIGILPETVEVGKALEAVLAEAVNAAGRKRIELISEIPKDTVVKADIGILQIIVRNLLNNAVKFTGHGGLIRLTVGRDNNSVQLKIKDSGIGMDETTKERMFSLDVNPSYGTDAEKGVGLGLVLCMELARSQGMNISFDSKFGEGTMFVLEMSTC